MADSRAPGLRLQIVLALAGLMVLAFVPLFFAVASLTTATLRGAHEQAARALGRAVAAHAGEAAKGSDPALLSRRLESDVGLGGVEAICVFDARGQLQASAGDPAELATMHAPAMPYGESSTTARGASGRALDVIVPEDGWAVVARLRTDDDADQAAPLVRLVALYMSTFALALLVFAYFALTRLIVRPVESLVGAADRVAKGSRALDFPRAGARELSDLGTSVQAMASRLMADEAAMRGKVLELTLATQRLTEAQAQLVRSERMASVGRLAAGVAHEIGNPIAAIMGFEELLLAGDLPIETQRDFLTRMKRETERIHSVLRDLLDFARPEERAITSGVITPADVKAVVEDVIALVRPQKDFKSIEVRLDLANDDLHVALAAPRLTQVLLNVLMNAGSVLGTRAPASPSRPPRVTVGASREHDHVIIFVEDNGPGIPPELGDRIFEPFVTTKDVGVGTGLGLAVCRGIVESAGGEIVVDPTYRDGARFLVKLPAVIASQ